MTGDGNAAKTFFFNELSSLFIETIFQVFDHAAGQEAVGIAATDLGEIVVLQTIDKLLHDDGCRHLCIVHV